MPRYYFHVRSNGRLTPEFRLEEPRLNAVMLGRLRVAHSAVPDYLEDLAIVLHQSRLQHGPLPITAITDNGTQF